MIHFKRAYAVLSLCAMTAVAARAQTLTTLANFSGTNGSEPGSLVQGTDANLYGTTVSGGIDTYTCNGGCGTIFKITPAGTLSSIHSFDGKDGVSPNAVLIAAANGILYGTTYMGGVNNNCAGGVGCGTVFSISLDGSLTTLYSFAGPDGAYPDLLVRGVDGDFYGTTVVGGGYGAGTFFKITSSGVLTTLRNFIPGVNSFQALIAGPGGNFYATSYSGGTYNYGAVYKVEPTGAQGLVVSFDQTNGAGPTALLLGADGNLYGTTSDGGTSVNSGTVFKITHAGALVTLHNFGDTDGTDPVFLIEGSDGSLYGTTALGGPGAEGTIFKVTGEGQFTSLASFNGTNGEVPGGLVQATSGVFYGTTQQGGDQNHGSVFSLSVGLGPFVLARPNLAKADAAIEILGTSLSGATSVTFNGTPSAFTVLSPTVISTTVPSGASSGNIQVVTPGGTLSSKTPFQVLP